MSKLEYIGAAIALLFVTKFTGSFGVTPLKTRLVGGSGPHEGRVEVFYEGAWGTVCDDSWDLDDANVVCRSLGFARALAYNHRAAFGPGEGSVVFGNVHCTSTASNLAECPHSLSHYCGHEEDAGVVCDGADPLPTRLVNGSGSHEGRVEVFYGGSWGTVCDDNWNIDAAHVVCRTLGYERASAFNMSAAFGEGTGPIILDDVLCDGSEPNIAFCQYHDEGYKSHNCGHHEDAGVVCQGIVSARLSGGDSERKGRVEVLYNGQWGTVCDDQFDLNDANVVCRMLGFSKAESLDATFGIGTGNIVVDDLECEGTEMRIQDCRMKQIGTHNCEHSEDIGVKCAELPVRLVGSTSPNQGRVHVYHEGSWGSICDDEWGIEDARVVCRMLGYPNATEALSNNPFPGNGDPALGGVLLDQVRCNGDETHISQCQHSEYGQVNCDHDEDAGVICEGKGDFRVRLADGPDEAQGRVELFYFGTWGTACHLNWTSADSLVVCKMLGYPGVLDTAYYSSYGPGSGNVLLRQPRCSGKESSLMDCTPAYPLGITECDHSMDIGVTCLRPNALQVRLVGSQSRNEGRVEVKYGSYWGTVCDDQFDLNDANVVCRMLGYHRASNYSCCGAFGQGSGDIVLDEVDCKGTESNIGECMRNVLGVHDCKHSEDVGVTCTGEGPNALESESSILPLSTTLTHGMLGGLVILLVIFFVFSTFLVNKVKVYRDKSLRLLRRRPMNPPVRQVLKTNRYGSYAQPAKAPGGLYPRLPIVKESPGKGPDKESEKGKEETKVLIVKPKTGTGSNGTGHDKAGKPSVVVVDDSKKGMLTSLIDKIKLNR